MNRERAETYLRLLAEAELRDAALPSLDIPYLTLPITLIRAAWALTTVGALEVDTAQGILADAELALAARNRPEPPGADVRSSAGRPGAAGLIGPRRFASHRSLLGRMTKVMPTAPMTDPVRAGSVGPDRYVPVGVMILFHDELISGELDLMSYAHTAVGARFTAAWRTRDPLGSRHRGLPPVEAFTLTDGRGQDYQLVFDTKGRPESTCDLSLQPEPPTDIGWLDITAPGERAVRVDLNRRAEPPAQQVSDAGLSVGEHLLNRIAERLLTLAPEHRVDLSHRLAAPPPRPVTNLAAGLGAAIAALQAAEVLPEASPVPARLAALCANLRISDHGITATPVMDLPEPWLSMLTHYHRRKPETAPARDDFAAVGVALPDLEGIRLVLLGLHNHNGDTWMNALALGRVQDLQPGPLGLDMTFPLSMWVRDGAGRWHVGRVAGWYAEDGEATLTLRLIPPLTRSSACLEVLVTGPSAQVRATLPLCWGCPP